LNDWLLEDFVMLKVRVVAISNTLHVLILGQQRVADASEQHHAHEN